MNKAIIKGRIGNNLEIKTLQNDTKVLDISIATNDGTKEKPHTNWHNCTAFNKTAETLQKWVKKGDELLIEGAIRYSQSGEKWFTSIIIQRFEFCGSRADKPQSKAKEQEQPTDDLPF